MGAPSLAGVDWREVRSACEGGLLVEKAAEVFQIGASTIRARAAREQWATVGRIQKAKVELQRERSVTAPRAHAAIAETLIERQEEHREIMHRMLKKALSTAEKAPPPIETMGDLEKAAKLHRLTLDMSTGDSAPAVQVLFTGGESSDFRSVTMDAAEVEVLE